MSIITFQFGQCGNQVGQSLYSYVYDDIYWESQKFKSSLNTEYSNCAKNIWFNISKKEELFPRAILIDTENKVTAAANKSIPYRFKNIVSGAYGGSANNWACGYNCKSNLLIGTILEATRKELEKCDLVRSFVSILGAGGGTGSGLGCYTIEKLREEYPSKFIFNCLILPHEQGEVVTQNYNAIHTLASLYDVTDASVIFNNDLLFKICTRNLKVEDANFRNFNSVITQQLAGIFQPIHGAKMPHALVDLIAHPDYKFLNTHSAPVVAKEHLHYEIPFSHEVIVNQIERNLRNVLCELTKPVNNASCLPLEIRCVGNVFFTRGVHSKAKETFLNEKAYVPWIPKESRRVNVIHERPLIDTDLSVTLISNNNMCSYYLDSIIQDAWTLFTNGAYVHHYKKFGVEEQDFLRAFEKLEDVLLKYRSL